MVCEFSFTDTTGFVCVDVTATTTGKIFVTVVCETVSVLVEVATLNTLTIVLILVLKFVMTDVDQLVTVLLNAVVLVLVAVVTCDGFMGCAYADARLANATTRIMA